MDKKYIKETISYERKGYYKAFCLSKCSFYRNKFLCEPVANIIRWQESSRWFDYYCTKNGLSAQLLRVYFQHQKNKWAQRTGIDASTRNTGKGLLIYHSYGIVINGNSILGENVHLHGNNCIGNAGNSNSGCPVIGNNVTLGVGAKVIGGITIADNIKIAAGAVVVHSFLEPGVTIGGIPAKIINK